MLSNVPINYVAVVVAAVANMALGFLWHGPLFGKQWMALMGITSQQADAMKSSPEAKNKMMRSYGMAFVGALVMAFVLAHFYVFAKDYMEADGLTAGLASGFWAWLGFVAPVTMGAVLWEQKPWKLWVINAGYYLIALLVMGILLSYWM